MSFYLSSLSRVTFIIHEKFRRSLSVQDFFLLLFSFGKKWKQKMINLIQIFFIDQKLKKEEGGAKWNGCV